MGSSVSRLRMGQSGGERYGRTAPRDLHALARGHRAAQPWRADLVRPRQELVRDALGRRPSRQPVPAPVVRGATRSAAGTHRVRPGALLPPYVGGRGWIGVRLDRDADWAEITELCQDAYRVIAPARLAARLDG